MQAEELIQLVERIQQHQSEFQTVEIKAAHIGCPTKLYDTLSSFSNQDDGGVIVFGVDENDEFRAVGVYDAQDLQKRITEQCNQMEPIVRPLFSICEYDQKTIVSAEIPGKDITERPVFYRGVGRLKGAYIRVGEADEHMTEYEIYSYDAFRKRIHDDMRIVDGARTAFFDDKLIAQFLSAAKKERENNSQIPDNEILELMGVTQDGKPTLAGLLTFSKLPQANFPQLCITAVVVPGISMGEIGPNGERFSQISGLKATLETCCILQWSSFAETDVQALLLVEMVCEEI